MKNSIKFKRYNKLIQKYIADIIVRDYSKNNIITITSVNIDFDFASTRVFVSAFKNTDDIVKFLNFSSKK